ncbi:hypothetical protein PAPHI01_2679 [Pancytospora philotis]|nr:hypothetical protein PAPHI01_2679 [Pancytospora philotis]
MQELGADLVFAPNKHAPVTELIWLDLAAAGHRCERHAEVLKRLKALRNTPGFMPSTITCGGEAKRKELARFAHGLVLFADRTNPYDHLHDCLSYGFFFVQTENWMKNRRFVFDTLIKSVAELREVLALMRRYSPLDMDLTHLVLKMHEHGITPDDDALEEIKKLHGTEQLESLSARLGHIRMASQSDYKIFTSFLNPAQIVRLLEHLKIAREDLDASLLVPETAVAIEPISSHSYDDGLCETDVRADSASSSIPGIDFRPRAANFGASPIELQREDKILKICSFVPYSAPKNCASVVNFSQGLGCRSASCLPRPPAGK